MLKRCQLHFKVDSRRRRRNQEAHASHGLNSTFLHKFKFKDKTLFSLNWEFGKVPK
jgi:hypothetical protein